jgi:hypothetical protein
MVTLKLNFFTISRRDQLWFQRWTENQSAQDFFARLIRISLLRKNFRERFRLQDVQTQENVNLIKD